MKKLFVFPLILTISCLSGCNFKNSSNSNETEQPQEQVRTGIVPINIYALNDFHGAVEEDYRQIGLKKLASFMKQETSKPNTLFIDSGDAFNGSLESNYNKGELINKAFSYANLSSMTIGNHDFDWSISTLKENISTAQYEVLGANIYPYDSTSRAVGTKPMEGLGKPYAVFPLENGVKVGIIGTIGETQISSVEATKMSTISFKQQTEIIKNLSDELRISQKCDIVISSSHASFLQVDSENLTKISPVSGKRYIDLMLNAHTHQKEDFKVNGVHFSQFGSYGEELGKITLYYNFDLDKLVDNSTIVSALSKNDINDSLEKLDPTIVNLVNEYVSQTKNIGDTVLSNNFSGSFYSSEQLPNLMCEAIYNESNNEGFAVDFAYTNYARASFYNTKFTERDLWKIFPFDNTIKVIEVTGKDAAYMLRYSNNIYKGNLNPIRYEGTYKVACIDYLANHVGIDRELDLFPIQTNLGSLMKDGEKYLYRDILKDYLLANKDKQFNASDYSFSNERFSRQ